MRILPILFNTEMVRAILGGRKTVTRRAVKPQSKGRLAPETDGSCWPGYFAEVGTPRVMDPPYHPGDILYVRETFFVRKGQYYYKADGKHAELDAIIGGSFFKWQPSIHMPKEAARLFLRVTDVRVERLLTPFFAGGAAIMELKKEGTTIPDTCVECIGSYGNPCCIDDEKDSECGILDEVRGEFSDLWDSTIKKADLPIYGWAANPWVWVIEFERISKEAALEGGGAE